MDFPSSMTTTYSLAASLKRPCYRTFNLRRELWTRMNNEQSYLATTCIERTVEPVNAGS